MGVTAPVPLLTGLAPYVARCAALNRLSRKSRHIAWKGVSLRVAAGPKITRMGVDGIVDQPGIEAGARSSHSCRHSIRHPVRSRPPHRVEAVLVHHGGVHNDPLHHRGDDRPALREVGLVPADLHLLRRPDEAT
jgi:hypothetical protein